MKFSRSIELVLPVDSALAQTGLEGKRVETYLSADRELSRAFSAKAIWYIWKQNSRIIYDVIIFMNR